MAQPCKAFPFPTFFSSPPGRDALSFRVLWEALSPPLFLASRFLRVVEVAAIASAHTMGQGERELSDKVATEAMRQTMDRFPCAAPS